MLAGCFLLQKVYGKRPENILAVNQLFHTLLGKYESAQVLRAFELWLERSPEFPTPADIVGIIKRRGRPPLTRETYIAVSRKDAEMRDAADWRLLREYEAEQRDEVSGFGDDVKADAGVRENIALRQQVKTLQAEVDRLVGLLREARIAHGSERPTPTREQKVRATADAMRAGGASDEDIVAFLVGQGVAG